MSSPVASRPSACSSSCLAMIVVVFLSIVISCTCAVLLYQTIGHVRHLRRERPMTDHDGTPDPEADSHGREPQMSLTSTGPTPPAI